MIFQKIIISLSLILFVSCKTIKQITYKNAKYLNLHKKYTVTLNHNKFIHLNKYYIDRNNIIKITRDKKNRNINIQQFKKNQKLFNLSKIKSKKLKLKHHINKNDSISLVILNGIVLNKKDLIQYNIEFNAIKSLTIYKDTESSFLNCSNNSKQKILMIITN